MKLLLKNSKEKKKKNTIENFQFLNNKSDNIILHKKLAFAVTISNITNNAIVFTLLICDVFLITVSNRTRNISNRKYYRTMSVHTLIEYGVPI